MKHAIMGLILLAAGFGVGYVINSKGSEIENLRSESDRQREEASTLEKQLDENRNQLDTLSQERNELADKNKELLAQIEALHKNLEAMKNDSELVKAIASGDEAALALAFGKYGDLKELKDADWEKIGSSMLKLREGILELITKAVNGEDLEDEDWMKLQQHNMPLVGFALSLAGKLPTHGNINGVFTHPLAQVNMMNEMLDGAGMSLSDDQAALLEELGLQFEKDWEEMDGQYDSSSLALDKLLDEADLKRDFLLSIEEELSDEQREIIFPELSRDTNMLDLFSPALMFSETGRPMVASSQEDLRDKMIQNAGQFFGMSADELKPHQHVFDRWISDVSEILDPIDGDDAMFYNLNQGLTAGRAQAAAVESLADALDLSEEKRQTLIENKFFLVPRIVKQKEQSEGDG